MKIVLDRHFFISMLDQEISKRDYESVRDEFLKNILQLKK